MEHWRWERLGGGVGVWVSDSHTFGTDAFLLSHFAAPKKHETCCDLCSGCGIVPLLWFRREAPPPLAYALEIQAEAVAQMEASARDAGLTGRFVPVQGDLRRVKDLLPLGELHLVTCNPPYKAEGSGIPSGGTAALIARHEILCTLDDVCGAAARLLRYHGRFCVCQLPERLVDLLGVMRRHDLEPKRIRFVQQRGDSAPWLVLVEGKRGARPFLQIEPPLLLKEGEGASPEMREVYGSYGENR